MKNAVFNSPYQDEVQAVDVGLKFVRGVPQPVTDAQAAILAGAAYFEVVDAAPAPSTPAPSAPASPALARTAPSDTSDLTKPA